MITTHNSTCILMSVQHQDSLSNMLDRLKKSTVQGNQLTRLSHCISTESQCDKKSLSTDLHKCWNNRETLSIKFRINFILSIIRMIIIQYLMSEHSSDSISNRLAQPEKNTSQKKYIKDSKATTTLINCVTEKAYQQIFQSLGPTRNFYTTDLDSLIIETRSYQ